MDTLDDLLGTDPETLTFRQMSLRTAVVTFVTLVYLRLADRRFLGRYTAFDTVLAVVFGSVMSRGINGTSPFFPTLGAGAVLLFCHWLVGAIAVRSKRFSDLVRGHPTVVVTDGRIDDDAMRRLHVTREDLDEAMRFEGHVGSVEEVARATMECNGRITVLDRPPPRPSASIGRDEGAGPDRSIV